MTVLLVIAILVLLIVVHEFGHFIAAKFSKVKVQEFGVGYPPRAFSFGRIGDTEYTLNWIPFGGFVRLFGDEGEQQHGKGSLIDAPRWKQAIILVAGVAMNALAAWMLFVIAFHIGVPQPVASIPEGQTAKLIVSDVVPGSPAYTIGIVPGDEIVSVVDMKGDRSPEVITPQAVSDFIRTHPGTPLEITYVHKGEETKATLTPSQGVLQKAADQPALGVALVLVANKSLPWGEAVVEASVQTYRAFGTVARDLWGLLKTVLYGKPDLSGVVGPVGIVGFVGDAAQNGAGAVLLLAALISVNLAIINLVPVPALDGGRLVILGIEAVLRRPAPRLAVQTLNAIGIALIIFLMIAVTYQDISRLFT